jgi:intein/homing endonuclease
MGIVRGFPEKYENEICEIYQNTNHSLKDIAEKFSCSTYIVRKILQANRIPIVVKTKINGDLKLDYFENIDSEVKAYLLGFIFADGNVFNNQLALEIGVRDKENLILLKSELKSKAKISYRKRPNTEVVTTRINSERLCNSLAKYGIVPNKTMNTHHLPNNIPKEYLRHFLRGVFDGDGWISIKFDKYYCMGYVCCYASMAEDFRTMANSLIEDKNDVKITNKGGEHSYVIQFQRTVQVKQLAAALYKDSNYYLSRKYEKAEKIFSS